MFLRKTRDGKTEKLDPNGKPVEAAAQADAKEDTPKKEASQKPKTDDRTVDELKAALDAAKVDYPSDALKADLLKLAADKGV